MHFLRAGVSGLALAWLVLSLDCRAAETLRHVRTLASTPIYDRPSGQGRIVARLAPGSFLKVLGESNNTDGRWFMVSLPGAPIGYVFAISVQEVNVAPDEPPPIGRSDPEMEVAIPCANCPAKVTQVSAENEVNLFARLAAQRQNTLEARVQAQRIAQAKAAESIRVALTVPPFQLPAKEIQEAIARIELSDIVSAADGQTVEYVFVLRLPRTR